MNLFYNQTFLNNQNNFVFKKKKQIKNINLLFKRFTKIKKIKNKFCFKNLNYFYKTKKKGNK